MRSPLSCHHWDQQQFVVWSGVLEGPWLPVRGHGGENHASCVHTDHNLSSLGPGASSWNRQSRSWTHGSHCQDNGEKKYIADMGIPVDIENTL